MHTYIHVFGLFITKIYVCTKRNKSQIQNSNLALEEKAQLLNIEQTDFASALQNEIAEETKATKF